MDLTPLLSAISSVGFPIIACIYMAYTNNEQIKAHHEEMSEITSAINELKIVIETLKEKIL